MNQFEVVDLELAREVIRKMGKNIENSDLPEDEVEEKLAAIDSVEEEIIENLRELLK